MALPQVAAFTDTYLPTVNGVTYTVKTWRDRWNARGGRMDVVYPRSDHDPEPGEYPVRSLPFPFYEGYRLGMPQIPDAVEGADLVHAHTPFSLGMAGQRLARRLDAPLVVSYHTPTGEYAEYLSSNGTVESAVQSSAEHYERWFLDRADVIVAPSDRAASHVRETVGTDAAVEIISNGVDIDFFEPVETAAFRERHDLPDGPLVGYTGRHGHEKCLDDILTACDGLDVTVVFGGDGPARESLEARAAEMDLDARFLGFLDREELPQLYAALDVFAFPSPVETQGLVALEANCCGTPVAAVDAGALSDTVDEGETGYTYPEGDVGRFREAIERALDERDRLRENCLARRESVSVEHAVDRLGSVYERVL
ncbi:glycosyltransferase family 4 protein [Haloarcula nitratireducens]|uniref:Glycosyltransferase family 4 protein n=1 Tax=Haloarcula nitratireducens TaxID=2487749 RepID=A0AAW4P9R3_9EURY|nr:glycosyltransferase family 4 protein [Halomicroarcula nitratireducens]MBX0294604.1 glycosyltransferase family 4 protein [Halomicroarcula nitratireducens]